MKGLLLKDLYTLMGFGRQYGIIMAFMCGWAALMKNPSFVTIYAIVLCSMQVISTMNLDESVSFCRYALTMPISVRTLVKEKYLLCLLTTAVGFLISVIFNAGFCLVMKGQGETFEGPSLVIVVALFLVVEAISLPVLFKLGAEKGRYINIVILMLVGAVILGAYSLLKRFDGLTERLELVLYHPFSGIVAMGVVLAICGLVLLLSYRVSLMMVKEKEW